MTNLLNQKLILDGREILCNPSLDLKKI
jgi:hypothetical protein